MAEQQEAGELWGTRPKAPKNSRSAPKGESSKAKTPKPSSSLEKDTDRRHRALEHQFIKVSKVSDLSVPLSEEAVSEEVPDSPFLELSPQSFGERHLGWPPEGPEE